MNIHVFSKTFMSMGVILLIIISTAVETDIFLPSFPALKEYFATTESKIQLLISVNFIGLCIASFFYGPLADAYGRRPVLLIGMLLFTLSSIACTLANSLEVMLFWRFIQGLGASVTFIVPKTMIHDKYDREEAVKILGIYGSIITFVLAFAPIIGNYLYLTYSWRANFIFIAILATFTLLSSIIFLRESLHKEKRILMHAPTIMRNYKKLLTNPTAMAYLYLCCAIVGAYVTYITNLSLIFINHLGVSKINYGYYQGVILLVFATMSLFSIHIINRLGMHFTRILGMSITVIGAILFLVIALWFPNSPLFITTSMTLFTGGLALNLGIFSGDYVNVYPEIKGVAAALGRSIGLIITLIFLGLSAYFFDGTMLPIAWITFFAGISSWAVLYWLHVKRNFS